MLAVVMSGLVILHLVKLVLNNYYIENDQNAKNSEAFPTTLIQNKKYKNLLSIRANSCKCHSQSLPPWPKISKQCWSLPEWTPLRERLASEG